MESAGEKGLEQKLNGNHDHDQLTDEAGNAKILSWVVKMMDGLMPRNMSRICSNQILRPYSMRGLIVQETEERLPQRR